MDELKEKLKGCIRKIGADKINDLLERKRERRLIHGIETENTLIESYFDDKEIQNIVRKVNLDLNKIDSVGREYTPSVREDEVNNSIWTVEEVMFYYGEWIENEEVAVDMMKEVMRRTPAKFRRSFSARMNLIRDLLKYEYGHIDIPFMSRYRRIK